MTSLHNNLDAKSLTLQWNVKSADTYDDLLSTATLTRFMLDTAWRLVSPELSDGVTSVTALIQVSHEQPTPAGETVTIEARVTEITDNIIRIAFKAVDETGVIARGFNERHVIDSSTLSRIAENRSAVLKKIL
jgi:fluoroacetyl-CoA thioesterase